MATLETPEKLRELQRALCQRAKKEPRFRAYALYDKVYRKDVVTHAYALTKANGGAPGPDGLTFEDVDASGSEEMLNKLCEELKTRSYKPGAVRRVYIPKLNGGERPLGIPNIRDRVVQTAAKLLLEPLFEANFDKDSYGFRPKKNAHQALDAIKEALEEGMHWVIDADVTAYFDSIPHERLMKAVAQRVADGAMLALVKMFLEAPVIDERDGGPPRGNTKGTPQGGVISPLLANIYLHLMDRNFRKHVENGALKGRLIRYADDFVVLSPTRPTKELRWVENLMERLGLQLHPSKTKVLDARKQIFAFLGHNLIWRKRKLYLDISAKSLVQIRERLRQKTRKPNQAIEHVVRELNHYIRGSRNYFKRVLRERLGYLDQFTQRRIARWWARKHNNSFPAWSLVRGAKLHTQYGLERWKLLSGLNAPPSRSAE